MIAPKIRPRPQLKNATIMVDVEMRTTALEFPLTRLVSFSVIQAAGLLNTRTCPNTRINIICTANTSKDGSHIPSCQYCNMFNAVPALGFPMKKKARMIVNKVRRTASVNGAGISFLKASSINREIFIVQISEILN